jgi:hypothetical protein
MGKIRVMYKENEKRDTYLRVRDGRTGKGKAPKYVASQNNNIFS